MRLSIDARVARRSARQHGLISRRQAVDLGMSPRQIQGRLASGAWVPVDPSVYRVAGAPHTWSTTVLAPCLSTGGLASHRSGAVIWGIGDIRRGRPEISVSRDRRFSRAGVRVHESRDIHLAARRVRDGIPVTGVARTLIDLGAVCHRDVVENATFDAINMRLVTWPKVLESFVQHSRQGRDGLGAMRWVIEKNLHKAMPQSRLEQRFERLLVARGLPLPDRQVELFDGDGFIGRVDFLYPASRIVVEVDGRSAHARRLAIPKDHARRNRLGLAGWTVLVFTWEDIVGDPDSVAAQVAAALAPARAA